jgi:hypothetical protein
VRPSETVVAPRQLTTPRNPPATPASNELAPQPRRADISEQVAATSGIIPTNQVPTNQVERPAAPPLAASAAPLPTPPPAALVTEAPATVRRELAEDQNIQEVLRRYQTAYDHLDAVGAKEIWPTVDVRALARAFDGLRSQDVVFDRCDLSVAGASARAVCSGRATYVRKIGSKDPQTEPRQWVFQLQKTDSSWTISQAETR